MHKTRLCFSHTLPAQGRGGRRWDSVDGRHSGTQTGRVSTSSSTSGFGVHSGREIKHGESHAGSRKFSPRINIHHSIHISLAKVSCKNTSNLEGHVIRRRRESGTLRSTSNAHPCMEGLIIVQVAEGDMTTMRLEPSLLDSLQTLNPIPSVTQLSMGSFLLHELLSLPSHLLLHQSNAKEKHCQCVTKMSEQME